MRKSTCGRALVAAVIVALIAGLLSVGDRPSATPSAIAAEPAPAPGSAAGAPAEAPPLTDILGPNAATWKFNTVGHVVKRDAGRSVLVHPASTPITLDSKETFGPGTEYEFVFRFTPPSGVAASFNVQLASATLPDKTVQNLSIGVSGLTSPTYNYIQYGHTLQHTGKPTTVYGRISLAPFSDRSLAWSPEFRAAIESQLATAPKLEDVVCTMRVTVEKDRWRTWLNGRFVNETMLPAGMDPTGEVKIQMYGATQLMSVRIAPMKPRDKRYEPVAIKGLFNASTIAGRRVDLASLVSYGSPATIGGVTFDLASPAKTGHDHLDLGPSWNRFGSQMGYFLSNGAHAGQLGGRWTPGEAIDPSRFCVYVPTAKYKALHIIAAADGDKDEVPIITAQFYRPEAGHPFNFAGRVPTIVEAVSDFGAAKDTPGGAKPIAVKTADGKAARLWHVTIPLDPDAFSWFSDLPRIGLELTKEVRYYRGYPDPLEYSWHAGGLPSSVHVYAATLEYVGVDVDPQPDALGHVWTAPQVPSYTIALTNRTGAATDATLTIATSSYDGLNRTQQDRKVALPAEGTPVKVQVPLSVARYGLHEVAVTVKAGNESATYKRSFAHLHPDTRDKEPWEEGRGAIWGFWPWGGGHVTPPATTEIPVMAAAGAETSTANYSLSPPEVKALAEKHRFISESAFSGGVMYFNGFYQWYSGAPKWDPAKPEETAKGLIDALKKQKAEPSAISRPTYVPFFAEPQIGNITTGIWPTHYGEEYKLTAEEQRVFDDMHAKYMLGAKAIRKEWPNLKLLLPYGDPMNTAVFLRLSPEARELIDGCALDLPGFERLPEQQVNQVVLNRLYPIMKDIKQYKPNPYLVLIEGTCISSADLDTGQRGQADIAMRDFLVLMGYGVTRFESCNAPFDCANYWGENHYGGGWCTRLPLAMPKLAYCHYATMTRHLNRANYVKYVPTGSTSVFAQQFKHYKTGKLVHVLWTVRGKRPVTVKVPAGATLDVFDGNDNAMKLAEKNGTVTLVIDETPVYLEGLAGDAEITLGESDHSDAKPAKEIAKVANFGDGSWKAVEKRDDEYEKNKPQQIERFIAKMSVKPVDAPPEKGGKALAVHLEKQEKDRGVMPYYTTLEPASAVTIPGKANAIGVWVHAASDWGRIVYVLRDAKGEKWLSVGTKEDWNNDDIHGWSQFCFDGWRYLRFQLPSNMPYDNYREHGSSWWGSYGGDNVVDLPVKLEKVMIERRPKVVYAADLVPAKPDDVLLSDVYAEYASAADRTEEAVRLSRVRMPMPPAPPTMANPIADAEKAGVGAATKALRVRDPEHQYDGTRCHVDFEPVADAKTYDVWVSPYPDGRGAMKLGTAWAKSGEMIQGLRPDITFYLFVTYTDAAGKVSKPSPPLAFTLKDRFGYK